MKTKTVKQLEKEIYELKKRVEPLEKLNENENPPVDSPISFLAKLLECKPTSDYY